jgi:hypothetical protein
MRAGQHRQGNQQSAAPKHFVETEQIGCGADGVGLCVAIVERVAKARLAGDKTFLAFAQDPVRISPH